MAPAERTVSRERRERKKKELELSLYSHNLSYRLLTPEGSGQPGSDLPDIAVSTFQIGSLVNRDAYWKENAAQLNYGQQMVEWIGTKNGAPGISQWVAKQTDEGVVSVLQEVGLKGKHEDVSKGLHDDKVKKVIDAINKDLQSTGQDLLDTTQLDDNQARSLIFYATYLNPTDQTNPGKDAKELIDTLVGKAMSDSGNDIAKAMEVLQNIAPLFRVAGEEGQHVLGALTVAKTHAMGSRDELSKVDQNAPLTEEEQRVLEFLRKRGEMELPEALQLGEGYDIADLFRTELRADPTPGHTYWIEQDIPKDFADKLTPDQLKNLEMRKSMWIAQNGSLPLNREVFDPAYTLADDKRFQYAEILTNNDSGLLALAAASAASPEKQAELYRQLGETVIKTHLANPKLIEEFMRAQTPESLAVFGNNETFWTGRMQERLGEEFDKLITQELREKFHIDIPESGIPNLTQEQQAFIDQRYNEFSQQKFIPALLSLDDPERVIAFDYREGQGQLAGMPIAVVNTEATVKGWTPERIQALNEALKKDPPTLTLEQMRQIEFLSHSVNVVKMMEMLKGTVAIGEEQAVVQPAPVGVEEEPVQPMEAVEKPTQAATLGQFFGYFDNLEEQIGVKRGQELSVLDSTHMEQFSTASEDIINFEVTDENRNLAIYTLKEENGAITPGYNTQDAFLGVLLRPDSLSQSSFDQLVKNGYGQNTLLAYVLEAAGTPNQQEALLKNVFFQIAKIYEEHSDLAESIKTYFHAVDEKLPNRQTEQAEQLFTSRDTALERLHALTGKLEQNEAFTIQDFDDMGFFALPFNLKYISDRMQLAYRSHHADSAEPQSPTQ